MRENYEEKKARILAAMDATELGKKGQWLFRFRKWFFVENRTFTVITEAGVTDKLKQYPSMSVTVFLVPESPHTSPPVLKGRKVKFIEEGDEQNISSFILTTTGCSIPVSELGGVMWNKDDRPLGVKVRAFMKSVEETKTKEEGVQRILKCLQLADAKRRKDCLNNCKSK